jgi:hypothetical protein
LTRAVGQGGMCQITFVGRSELICLKDAAHG